MMSTLRPRANITQPMRGRACGNMGAPVRNPRRKITRRPPRCAVHAARRPAARVRARKAAVKVTCQCSGRESDQEAELARPLERLDESSSECPDSGFRAGG